MNDLRSKNDADGSIKIDWVDPVKELKYDGSSRTYLMFEGAVYLDDTSLPNAIHKIKVGARNDLRVNLIDAKFEEVPTEQQGALAGVDLPNKINVTVSNFVERKQSFARVSFIPLRKNPSTGKLERLISYKLNTQEFASSSRKSATASNFATSSVLASGDWYKVGVTRDGVHRITYQDLEALGMDMGSIDPSRLNVFGNGSGMLPQANNKFRHDDLKQIPIQVVGEGDGNFGPGDYILFYAQGPHTWVQDSSVCGLFRHEFNVYSETSYYFISANAATGRRISSVNSSTDPATHTVTKFTDHVFHEVDNHNILKSGRDWYGEEFDIQTFYDFDLGFSNVTSDPGYLSTRVLATSSVATTYSVRVNGSTVENVIVPSVSGGYNRNAEDEFTCTEVQFNSGNTNVAFNYSKGGNPGAVGWLDYFDVILTRNLSMAGTQMPFRTLESVGQGNVSEFQISNANASVRVWEVTDPTNVTERVLDLQGSTAKFRVETDSLREFIAFNGGSYHSVQPVGPVANQNLHGLSQANMFIVCHPNFLSEADRLANFHEQNETSPLSVHIVTPEQIYNEFSSGAQDVSAIRDFMRMFYQRSTGWEDMPRYLLLFGDASYDYKDRLSDNTNYVPTYESLESLTPTISYASDDYYGLLDPNEGEWSSSSSDALDIGIGRFVVRTLDDARVAVDKIYRYEELAIADLQTEHVCTDEGSAVVSPDWRNRIVFIADDEDSNMHINQADQLAELVDTMYPEYNLTKIYLDSYIQESTPGGQRYPEVNIAFNNEVNRGNLLVNYTGHGGELGLTHERVLGITDINSWANTNNLAAFVTATCEFTRYDDPSRISAGELVHLNPNGGGIALFTTSRLVYSAPNFTLNRNFFLNLLQEQLWGPPTMGDVIRMTKVA
ncbi:MAG: type IX secretion system sortase PorU, partial [Flavobacteriales bacterium]|nr:type IX secretion system sortase PorU [Flavobacteriales bacterium]